MTSSIAGTPPVTDTRPRRPVLRPLADVLPDLDIPAVATLAPPLAAPPQPDPHARAMADRVLRVAVEIVGGRRPPHQLASVLRPVLLDYLLGLQRAGAHLRPRVHSVHSQQPVPGVLEAMAVVVLRTGVRALCARFEQTTATRWRCTVLHLALTRGDLVVHRGLR